MYAIAPQIQITNEIFTSFIHGIPFHDVRDSQIPDEGEASYQSDEEEIFFDDNLIRFNLYVSQNYTYTPATRLQPEEYNFQSAKIEVDDIEAWIGEDQIDFTSSQLTILKTHLKSIIRTYE